MAVDENPFPQPIDVNMVIPNLDKFVFPIFKLVVNRGDDEPCLSTFEHLKRNAVGTERSRAIIESKVARLNALEDGEEEDIEALKEHPLKGECVEKSKFEHRKDDEDDDDVERLITIQFGTMSPVMPNNYLLANKFKNKEHDEEITKENKEAACLLECGECTSPGNQLIHSNDGEEDDEVIDIQDEIDLEAESRIRRVSYNNLLGQLYQEGNLVVGLLGEPYGRSFDYYVLYGMPTKKKMVHRAEKYGLPPKIVLPPTSWKEL
ncbi:hypothetical protein Adt_31426 [Abeliophyllum distichum]|uniref:Uncharacterized protein n=1 Tax=Abeliophyllum distichum TaxID=126358 RepID=A0ABD1RE35_9LAMI